MGSKCDVCGAIEPPEDSEKFGFASCERCGSLLCEKCNHLVFKDGNLDKFDDLCLHCISVLAKSSEGELAFIQCEKKV